MKHSTSRNILIVIIVLGAILRFTKISTIPNIVNRDEAAIGYNAYSILKTGKDEFGSLLPISFISFGDYKLPGYIYGSLPFIWLFGLSNFSVRLLSAISGVLLIIVLYQLAFELFKKREIALLSAFSLSISPWAIFYSRTAFETNVATLLFTTGILFLLKGLKKPWLWILSSISILFSLLTYNNPYIVGPILLVVFALFQYKKILMKQMRSILLPFILLLIGSLAIFFATFSINQSKARITIVKDPGVIEEFWAYRKGIVAKNAPFSAVRLKLIGNKYVFYGTMFAKNILKNFSLFYLTQRNSNHIWNGIQGIGHFYISDYVLFVIGIFAVLKQKNTFIKTLVFVWLIAGVLPAALTIHQAHPNRGMLSFIIMHVFIAVGAYTLFTYIKKFRKFILIGFLALYFINLVSWASNYFILFQQDSPGWFTNLDTAIQYTLQSSPQTIILSNEITEGYMYFLFYTQFDPATYQQTAVRTKDAEGFYKIHSFGNVLISELTTLSPGDYTFGGNVSVLGLTDEQAFLNWGQDLGFYNLTSPSYAYKMF